MDELTEEQIVLDKLLGKIYTAVQAMDALTVLYPIQKMYPLRGDNCRKAYRHLRLVYKMQDNPFLSGEEFFPISVRWFTAITDDHAIMFQMSDINTWRLYVFAKTSEGLAEYHKLMSDSHLL